MCDVVTMAKRDLQTGETLDGIGGYTCYGVIENASVSRRDQLLPMGISEDCEMLREVAADQALTYADVKLPDGRLVDTLREEQNRVFA